MIPALLDWFGRAGTSLFDLAVQRRHRSGRPAAFLAPSTTRAQALAPDQLLRRLSWLRAENANGGDIYFRPARRLPHRVVFLDDLPQRLAHRIAAKYGSAIIRTSPNRCHLWLSLAQPADEQARGWIQRDLVDRLDGAADPGSVSGEHWGRLPGFRNRKPERDCWVDLIATTEAEPYHATLPANPPAQIHRATRNQPASSDMSRAEWGWVLGSLENGIPPDILFERLVERATPRRGRTDATRYARYTIGKACRIKGCLFSA